MAGGTAALVTTFNVCRPSDGGPRITKEPEEKTGKSASGFNGILMAACRGNRQEKKAGESPVVTGQGDTKDEDACPENGETASLVIPELQDLSFTAVLFGVNWQEGTVSNPGGAMENTEASPGHAVGLAAADGDARALPDPMILARSKELGQQPAMTVPDMVESVEGESLNLIKAARDIDRLLSAEPEADIVAAPGGRTIEGNRIERNEASVKAGSTLPGGLSTEGSAGLMGKITVKTSPGLAALQQPDLKSLILSETVRSQGVTEKGTAQAQASRDGAVGGGSEQILLVPGGPPASLSGTDIAGTVFAGETGGPVKFEELFDQAVQKLDLLKKPGQSEIQVVLKPEVLGRLTIRLSLEDHQVTARFLVENHMVKQVMEANLPQLRAALEASGLKLDQAEVALHHQYSGSHDFHGQSGFFQQRAPVLRHTYLDSGSEFRPEDLEESVNPYAVLGSNGAGILDCVV